MKKMLRRWLAAALALCLLVVLFPVQAKAEDYIAACHTYSNGLPYYIMVNRQCNTVTIYTRDENGYYNVPYKAMICSTARAGHYTPVGTFHITYNKQRWCYMVDGSYGQYSCQFSGNYLFHSVCYTSPSSDALMTDEYNLLGSVASLGCVRLQVEDAKWIYDNCAAGTYVTVYDGADPGPLGKPEKAVAYISAEDANGWEPTDPTDGNPWRVSVTAGISASGTGSGSVSGSGTYIRTNSATVQAVPASGSSFSGWFDASGNLVSSAPSYSFTVSAGTTLYARFDRKIAITGIGSRSGSVSGSAAVPSGQSVTLRASSDSTPFVGWYDTWGNPVSSDPTLTVTATADRTYYALFEGDVFADVEDTWYTDSVMQCYEKGIFSGMTNVTFAPSGTMTRAMAVAILARMDGSDPEGRSDSTMPFTDVSESDYYYSAVCWAYNNEIVAGVTDTTFCPNEPVTREQFMAILMRYLVKIRGYAYTSGSASFTDSDSFSTYAYDDILMAADLGLVYGYPDGSFRPTGMLTRAEGASFMIRLYNLLNP